MIVGASLGDGQRLTALQGPRVIPPTMPAPAATPAAIQEAPAPLAQTQGQVTCPSCRIIDIPLPK
jgi:hypothetical protein